MALAAYGAITPRTDPNEIYKGSAYGWYLSHIYTTAQNNGINRMQPGYKGHGSFGGAWGSCTQDGEGWGTLVAAYIQKHGLQCKLSWS